MITLTVTARSDMPEQVIIDYIKCLHEGLTPYRTLSWGMVKFQKLRGDLFNIILSELFLDNKPVIEMVQLYGIKPDGMVMDSWVSRQPDYFSIDKLTVEDSETNDTKDLSTPSWVIYSKGVQRMVLYFEAYTNAKYVPLDGLVITDGNGCNHHLTWDDAEFGCEPNNEEDTKKQYPYLFSARYKGVYIDGDDTNGNMSKITPFDINEILFDESDDYPDAFVFKPTGFAMHDGDKVFQRDIKD